MVIILYFRKVGDETATWKEKDMNYGISMKNKKSIVNVVVVCGQTGAGSSTIAKLLAKKLRYRHFSAGDYFKKFGSGKNQTEKALKFHQMKESQDPKFHRILDKIQVKEAKKGSVVIDSKLGIYFLKSMSGIFKVWIKADRTVRIKRFAERDNSTIEASRKRLNEKERDEHELYKKIYGFDIYSQKKDADLVIDTSVKMPDELTDEIIRIFRGCKKP
ncbi:MAG: cytidylate kinase family protein [Candidatus Aenigmarchaeota archaeon]|nr:cytidylate kinase family protein [Candidatus Aenigmarchaeota archaeon]